MTKRSIIYVLRQSLLGMIALQILNLSVGTSTATDGADVYDYSYTYNKTYDPTESAIEWIVELKCGQQPGFSYNRYTETGKSLSKSFHWKTDLQKVIPEPAFVPQLITQHPEQPSHPFRSLPQETFSPPPEGGLV